MTVTNGKVAANVKMISTSDISDLSITQPIAEAKRKPTNLQNKYISINLDLDAGSANCKFVINGEYSDTFPTIFKEVQGELPLGISGCFSIGSKNFAVGQVAHSLNGNLIEACLDNKIKRLDVWLIGALTSHPDLLTDIAGKRKYKAKPARLKITLRLTLEQFGARIILNKLRNYVLFITILILSTLAIAQPQYLGIVIRLPGKVIPSASCCQRPVVRVSLPESSP